MEKKNKFFRFAIINDNSLEEIFNIKFSRASLLWLTSIILLAVSIVFVLLLGYTPLRNLIPGKSKTHVQNELIMMIQKADSLEKSLGNYSLYTKNLKKVLSDSVSNDIVQDLFEDDFMVKEFDFQPSGEDSILRAEVEAEESISLNSNLKEKKLSSFFIKPVNGLITEGFNKKIGHFGIDVVSKKGAFISSIDDGMVLFSSWTHEFGYVLIIKHQNSFISFYKHNSEVFKSKGDYVKSGEMIAIIGNSGKYSTGPHLHFELWKGSSPVNPMNYILF
ncbi:M23 family metallopeptidase [Bacteroidota bacterium]|nr:M23 family metallopeptidase [Bacteroidota bacterium]